MTDPLGLRATGLIDESGSQLRVRLELPWMRALPVSCIEAIDVTIAGVRIPESDLDLRLGLRSLPSPAQLGGSLEYWHPGEPLTLVIGSPRGGAGSVVEIEVAIGMPDLFTLPAPRRVVTARITPVRSVPSAWPLGVCTFGFAGELRQGTSLRSCLRETARSGNYTRVEVLGAQLLPGYPYPAPHAIAELAAQVEDEGFEPFCYDAFLDPSRVRPGATVEALLERARRECDTAAALGCAKVRINAPLEDGLLGQCSDIATDHGLELLYELHAKTVDDDDVRALQSWLAANPAANLRFVLDLSCVMRGLPTGFLQMVRRYGASETDLKSFTTGWRRQQEWGDLAGDLQSPTREVEALYRRARGLFRHSAPSWLSAVLDRTAIVHAKFFDIVDQAEQAIDYPAITQILVDERFSGTVMAEFEGHLWDESQRTFDQIAAFPELIGVTDGE